MSVIHSVQGYGVFGARIFRFLFLASLFAYSALNFLYWCAAWHAHHSHAVTRDPGDIGIEAMRDTQSANRQAGGVNGWISAPRKAPASRRHDSAYRSVRARVKRREVQLAQARMRYLRIRRQVAVGRLTERDALKARARVEAASEALQTEKDNLALLRMSGSHR